jgi:hypothetical protein
VVNKSLITDILAVYKKHGWELRRVLLTKESANGLKNSFAELFGEVEITGFDKDAAWFSRPSGKDGEAWEIRLLSETPYALIEVFGPDQDEAERADIRLGMEQRLLETNPVKIKPGN